METALQEQIDDPPITADRAAHNLWHTVFSFPGVLVCLLILLSVFSVRTRLNDPDMWWHLKTGEMIWQTHSIPRVDSFSFTTNHHAYTPHEWLSQVTIYAAYHFAGYSGIMLWLCLLTSLLLVGGYALCWLHSGNGKIAFLGAVGIWLFATVGLAARPQMIGYLFLIVELIILLLGRWNHKWFFALPALFAVWVNCHGSFLLGLIVATALLFCGSFEFAAGLVHCRRWSRRERVMLALALVFSAAALFLNPVGLSQISYPVNTTLGGQRLAMQYSSEWQPPVMSDFRTVAMFAAVVSVLLIPLLRRASLQVPDLLLVAVGFAVAIQHQRMLFVFGILVMPVLSHLLSETWDGYEASRDSVLRNVISMGGLAALIIVGFPSPRTLMEQVNKANPVKAVEFVQNSGLSGRMLNEYVYGGYLIWAAPDHNVFVDGRSDVFEWAGVLRDYIDWVSLNADPGFLLKKYQIDFCLLSREEPITRLLALLPGWKEIYSDKTSVIFSRSGSSTEPDNASSRPNKPEPDIRREIRANL